jgi:hypothetical protein
MTVMAISPKAGGGSECLRLCRVKVLRLRRPTGLASLAPAWLAPRRQVSSPEFTRSIYSCATPASPTRSRSLRPGSVDTCCRRRSMPRARRRTGPMIKWIAWQEATGSSPMPLRRLARSGSRLAPRPATFHVFAVFRSSVDTILFPVIELDLVWPGCAFPCFEKRFEA